MHDMLLPPFSVAALFNLWGKKDKVEYNRQILGPAQTWKTLEIKITTTKGEFVKIGFNHNK